MSYTLFQIWFSGEKIGNKDFKRKVRIFHENIKILFWSLEQWIAEVQRKKMRIYKYTKKIIRDSTRIQVRVINLLAFEDCASCACDSTSMKEK